MVSLVGLHRFVGPSANRDPKRSHSRGPGDGRWLPWRNDGRWYRPKILRKTQNTKHFNTSTLPVLGHKKEWHTQKDTLGPAIFVPPPKKKRAPFRMQYPSVPSNWSCLPPPSGNYRSCQQPGRSHKHPGRQTIEVTSSARHLRHVPSVESLGAGVA